MRKSNPNQRDFARANLLSPPFMMIRKFLSPFSSTMLDLLVTIEHNSISKHTWLDMSSDRLQNIHASDIMVRNVIHTTEDTKIREIERQMIKQGIGGLPVVREENGKKAIVGILTHRDIMLARHAVSIGGMDVKDLMSHDITTVNEESTLLDILQKMEDKNIERLPVINKNGSLVGMVMHKNILSCLLQELKASKV